MPLHSPPMTPSPAPDSSSLQPILAPLCSVFRRYLKSQDLRYTTERADILEAVMNCEDLFEADSLMASMREAGSDVSKATVYRTLRLLQEAGIITPIMFLDAKQTHYQLAYGREPADFLVCTHTGAIKQVHSDAIIGLRERLAAEVGWSAVGHRFVIYGVSPDANAEARSDND